MNALFQTAFLLLFFSLKGLGQDTIFLKNPSFEDVTGPAKVLSDWAGCDIVGETPPDIQPGSFSVKQVAQDGGTYLGLVVRDNETSEAVGQQLSMPLKAATSYSFSLYLCRSPIYLSASKATGQEVNYATPVKLRIWGGNAECDKKELLAESDMVANTDWKQYDFELEPIQFERDFIIIEAYYKTPVLFAYNGNILLDNCSPIVRVKR